MKNVNYRRKVINSVKYCSEIVKFKILRGAGEEFKKLNDHLIVRIIYTYIGNSKD